jgi:uncharacterized membrane protein YccC
MTPLYKRALISSISNFLSVALALYVAFALNLQNPWWAMVTVYFTQPPLRLTGAVWAKATWRIGGTLIGGAVSIALIPHIASDPVLIVLCVGGWLGLCVYGGLHDRTPRQYMFLLAGYTFALVGLPMAWNPAGVFDVVVARVEEIVIGVLAAAVVQSLISPQNVAEVALAKIDTVMSGVGNWIVHNLTNPTARLPQSSLALDLAQVTALAADWRFEGTLPPWRQRALWALEERLVALLPSVSAAEDLLAALTSHDHRSPKALAVAARVAAWASTVTSNDASSVASIQREIKAAAPELTPTSPWADLLHSSLTVRLSEVVTLWEEAHLLARAIKRTQRPKEQRVLAMIEAARPRSLHVDRVTAAQSAFAAAITMMGLCVFSILTRWELGVVATSIAGVVCALFSAQDDPTPMTRDLLIGIVAIGPVGMIYEFALLPRLDGYLALMVSLAFVLIPLGMFAAQPKHALKALGALAGFAVSLTLQPAFSADFPNFLNGMLAAYVGTAAALVSLRLIRIVRPETAAARLMRAGWRELAEMLRAPHVLRAQAAASRTMDRIGLLIPRLLKLQRAEEAEFTQVLREPRLVQAILDLKIVAAHLQDDVRTDLEAALSALADHADRLGAGAPDQAPVRVLARLDAGIAGILGLQNTEDRRIGAAAALSLRRAMFPAAPTYPQQWSLAA